MSKRVADQADGLRRLLSRNTTRVVAVIGMHRDDGATATAMNLAAALMQQGKDVLLIDEHAGEPASASAIWSLNADADRGTGARADCGVAVCAACATDAAAGALPSTGDGGVVLIDAAFDAQGHLSARAQRADELVLVLRPDAASLTAAYAGVKRLHYAHGVRQMRCLVNQATDSDVAGRFMMNLAATGSRYLAVSLEPAGWVRADAHHADAARLRQTVVEAFPASPAAQDFRCIAEAMARWPWRDALPPASPSSLHMRPAATAQRASAVAA